MKTEQGNRFPDGWYGVFPNGSCYQAVQLKDDVIIDRISEANAGSHRNGGNWEYIKVHDAIAGLTDLGDMLDDEAEHAAFVQLIDPDWVPYAVHVCRLHCDQIEKKQP